MEKILVPIDGSETSYRALGFAADLAARYDAALDVVHVTDDPDSDAVATILARARDVLDEAGLDVTPRVSTDLDLDFRPSNQVGEEVLAIVAEGGYDHVVMGHHGRGAVDRAILGSATETVVRADAVAVTIVP